MRRETTHKTDPPLRLASRAHNTRPTAYQFCFFRTGLAEDDPAPGGVERARADRAAWRRAEDGRTDAERLD